MAAAGERLERIDREAPFPGVPMYPARHLVDQHRLEIAVVEPEIAGPEAEAALETADLVLVVERRFDSPGDRHVGKKRRGFGRGRHQIIEREIGALESEAPFGPERGLGRGAQPTRGATGGNGDRRR